jgi:hypothetical protein
MGPKLSSLLNWQDSEVRTQHVYILFSGCYELLKKEEFQRRVRISRHSVFEKQKI